MIKVRRIVAIEGKVILPHKKYLEPGAVYMPEGQLQVPIRPHGQYGENYNYGWASDFNRDANGEITMEFEIQNVDDPQKAKEFHEMYWPSFFLNNIVELKREPYPIIMSACLREIAMVPDEVKGAWGDR